LFIVHAAEESGQADVPPIRLTDLARGVMLRVFLSTLSITLLKEISFGDVSRQLAVL
jgi:hypothetical protein